MKVYLSLRKVTFFVGVLCFAFLAGQSTELEAASLHSIIVTDTNDESIGDSTAIDFNLMKKEVSKIAKYTGLDLKQVALKGAAANPEKLLEKINLIKVNSDDVVIFYFSGHGYRTSNMEGSPWPNLAFSVNDKAASYEYLSQILKEKNPRFLLMIADACNNLIPEVWAPLLVKRAYKVADNEKVIKNNYRRLFLQTKGTVMVTSSTAGEFSYATNKGGVYTLAWIQSMGEQVKGFEFPTWENLLARSSDIVSLDQHPDFHIELEILPKALEVELVE